MLAVSTWHASSTVTHSLKCNLVGDRDCLVVAKVNTLEVHDLTPTGLTLKCSFDVWGIVTSLLSAHRKGQKHHSLLLTTDHPSPTFYVLDFDPSTSQLVVSYSLSLALRAGREAEFFNGAVLHPNGKVLVSCAYSGTLKVIILGEGDIPVRTEFDCRVPELNIHSMCFVPSTSKIVLAILFEDHHARKHVIARELKVDEQELQYEHSPIIAGGFVQDQASLLIPVPGQRKTPGVIALGGSAAHFIGSERVAAKRASRGGDDPVHSLAKCDLPIPFEEDLTYTAIDDTRFLIGNSHGYLCLLRVSRNGPSNAVSDMGTVDLGRVSPVSTITHITGPHVYIGSALGDSQTIHILTEPNSNKGYVRVVDTYTNIGPILDAVLVDPDGSGQHQVVTCSGGSHAGSLRVIRSGAELRRSATIQNFPNIEEIFPLRPSFVATHHSTVLFTTLQRTTVLAINSTQFDELDSTEFPGFVRTARTLAAGNLDHEHRAVQVTTTCVVVVDMTTGVEVDRWPAKGILENITCAAVNPTQVIIALKGGKLMLFTTQTGLLICARQKQPEHVDNLSNDVSALSIDPPVEHNKRSSNMVAVAYWTKNTIMIYNLKDFASVNVKTPCVHEEHAPVSLLLHTFGTNQPHLLVGLGNGTLVTYGVSPSHGLTNRRAMSLGNDRPVKMAPCLYGFGLNEETRASGDQAKVVFAAGSRACIMWFDTKGKRLRGSPVSVKNTSAVCSVDYPKLPGSVLVASELGMIIGRIGELNKLNIRTIPFGLDRPRQIAYHPHHDALAVGCLKLETDPATGDVTSRGFVKILDAVTFEDRNLFSCLPDEDVTCVETANLGNPGALYVVVGMTSQPDEGNIESTQGRIMVLGGADAQNLNPTVSIDVPGCVYALTELQEGYLAAAINTCIYVYQLEAPEGKESFRLTQRAKWDRGYLMTSATFKNGLLAVGDALRSVDVLKFEGSKLVTVAKNCNALWPLAVGWAGNDSVISAEGDHNLSLFKREGSNLERVGGFHYGELVNRFIPGSISSVQPEASVHPELVAVTSTGRISVVAQLDETTSLRLTELQRNLGYILKGPGGAELSTYRAPVTSQGAGAFAGFIDGDFIERFSDLSEEQVQSALDGRNEAEHLSGGKGDILHMVEQIAALHQ